MYMGLGGLRELVMDREALHAAVHRDEKSQMQLNWTELSCKNFFNKSDKNGILLIQIYFIK